MGKLLNMAVSAALMLMLTLAGCGGSNAKSQSASTPASSSQTTSPAATTPTGTPGSTSGNAQASKAEHTQNFIISMSSPVFSTGNNIPARYTCDGAGASPPLQWGSIPHGTVQLALFILSNDVQPSGKPLIYWAVAGLDPTIKGISAGELPSGAIVGRNSLGQSRYTICPAKSQGLRHYAVVLLALPRSIAATPGFDASVLLEAMRHTAEYAGLTAFTYQRR